MKSRFLLFVGLLFLSNSLQAGDSLKFGPKGSFLGVCAQVTRETPAYNPYAIHEDLMDTMKSLNLNFTRSGFKWRLIHPSHIEWDWRVTDDVVASAREKKVNLLALVGSMPRWAADDPMAYIDLWVEFVDSLSNRYKGDISCWELWNEPNGRAGRYWPQDALPEPFANYVISAARVIRKNQPEATILLGGLTTGRKAQPFEFWEDLFKLGVLEVVDGIAYHPYQYGGMALLDFNQRLFSLVARYTTDQKEYWITEFGIPAVAGGIQSKFDYAGQEQSILKSALVHWASGGSKFFIFDLQDKQVFDAGRGTLKNRKQLSNYFGLLKKDGAPKPSFEAVSWLSPLLQTYIPVKIELKKGGVLITTRNIQTGDIAFFSWGGRVHREILDQHTEHSIRSYESEYARVDLSGTNSGEVEALADQVLFWR